MLRCRLTIISNDLILIHMQKGAGTAFARAIIRMRPDALYWGYDPEGEARSKEWAPLGLWKHSTAYEVYQAVPLDIWNNAYKVLVSARHPLDRLISHYAHHSRYERLSMSFQEFLRSVHLRTIEQYATAPDGTLLVDDIVMFDDLEGGFERVTQRIGLPEAELSIENENPQKDKIISKTDVTAADIDYIAKVCAWELKYFGWGV